MLKLKARGVLLAILLVFVVSVMGFGTASAQTTDPVLNTYQDPSSAPYRTEVLDNDSYYEFFLISPSIDAPDAPASFFSSEADAESVARSVIAVLVLQL